MRTELSHCPCCGHDLAQAQPVQIGALRHDPMGDTSFNGAHLPLAPAEHIILGTLARSAGAVVTRAVLEERIGYEGLGNVVDVYLVRIRRKLREAGAPATAIQTLRHRGYRLNVPLLEEIGAGVGNDRC